MHSHHHRMLPDAEVALGGTFEVLHRGHRALLTKAFSFGGGVLIGLTTDGFANETRGRVVRPYRDREWALREHLQRTFPLREFVISPIEDEFGPALEMAGLKVLVVSENTYSTGVRLNEAREGRGLPPLRLVRIPHVMADDALPISSSRILAGEIDEEGRVVHG
jgi:cytidyltransferase-like protein